jgi:hypothetical protein
MNRAFLQRPTPRRVSPRPWVSPPRPPLRPPRCAYWGVWPPTVRCGQEHTAYAGEWLCPRYYARLVEGPVLFSHHEARHV